MNTNKLTVLSVSNISVSYNHISVLDSVSFDVVQGSCVGIIGPNGAGKSSLLKAIMGIIPMQTGNVTFFGTSLQDARKRVAYVTQRAAVDWDFPVTVFDVALMGRYVHLGWFKRPTVSDKTLVMDALDRVEMSTYVDRPIGMLSGGQQQRAFIARALAQDADLYIMDEPFAGVDRATEHLIIVQLKQLCQSGKTVIVVHHDLQTLERYFDSLIVLNKSVIQQGLVHEVIKGHALDTAYAKNIQNFLSYSHQTRQENVKEGLF